jgi:uncharacterized protein YuzE
VRAVADVYVTYSEAEIVRTVEPGFGLRVDLDAHGEVVGAELMNARQVNIDGVRVG